MQSKYFSLFSVVKPVCVVTFLAVGLSACSQVKENLGMGKRTPDEFAVVSHRPLELPSNLEAVSLPEPTPGAARPQEQPARQEARDVLFGPDSTPRTGDGSYSVGESALLRAAGADAAVDPELRWKIDQEQKARQGERTILERVMVWRDPKPKGVVVDPVKEAERLRANEAEGRPVTAGETPSQAPETGGTYLGDIF